MLLITLLAIIVGFVLLPVVLLVRAALHEGLAYKALWIILMVLLWPFAQFAYGIIKERSRGLRILTWLVVLPLIPLIPFLITQMEARAIKVSTEISGVIQSLISDEIVTGDNVKENLIQDLAELKSPLQEAGILEFREAEMADILLDNLKESYRKDNHISRREYQHWHAVFAQREVLDLEKLDEENKMRLLRQSGSPRQEGDIP